MTVGLPRQIHSTSIQVKPATAVAICVTVIAMPACMPAVTAEPALKPNQPTHSSEAPMKVSTMLCGGPDVLALAEADRAHQAGNAGIDMHHGAAGEVEHLEHCVAVAVGHEAVRAPDPMRDRRIDEDRPQADEPQHRGELHALGESTGDQRRRDDREGHLEAEIDGLGDGHRQAVGSAGAVRDVAQDALQERAVDSADEWLSRP